MKKMFLECKQAWLSAMAFVVMFVVSMEVLADVPLRRPISPERPMLLVHIDTWNYPDPERIIEMVPEDILPYVVFNISLSASDNVCADGYAVAGSWLKACAQKRAWAIVQCASGGHSRFSDHDLSVYEDYFRKYPNFLGWNFAEQFWGFGEEGTPSFLGAPFVVRRHFEDMPPLWRLSCGKLYPGILFGRHDAHSLYEAKP